MEHVPHANGASEPTEPSTVAVALAFAAVYLVWGSTYLAIRFAIETMPPLGMAAVRFLVAGGILYVWMRLAGTPNPDRRQWRDGAITGVLLLVGGNGGVVLAEQWVPSGLVALLVATVPLWIVMLDALFGSRDRPSLRTVAGLVTGFAGVIVLAGSPGVGAGGRLELLGAGIVLVGSLSWAAGSIVSRHMARPPRPKMLVAIQMLVGGTCLGVLSLAAGEADGFVLAEVSLRSWLALGYLIVAGAIIGYAAYIWLLTVVTPARASTYAYVNPVVAMLLGWWLASEPLTFRSIIAAAIILSAVVTIAAEAGPVRGTRAAERREWTPT